MNIGNGQSAAEQILTKPTKGLKVDSEYLEVHRLTPNQGVGSSDPKYRGSSNEDRDIVSSVSKDTAVSVTSNTDDAELTTPREQ